MIRALVMLVLAAGWRIVAVWDSSLANFTPLMALTFCGGVYLRDRRLWLVPFAALVLSDLYLDHYYATKYNYTWDFNGAALRMVCFGVALGLGWMVSRRKNWLNLLSGALGGAVFFYLATNTGAWLADATYAHTVAGWWQALTVGHPEFPPTLFFFRNSLVSDLAFTGVFALAMEYLALRKSESSLLKPNAVRA